MLISILNLIPSGYWTSQTMKCIPSMILLFCCCVFCLRTKWPHSTFPTSAWRRSWFLRLSRSGGRREGSQSTSLSIKEGALYATMAPSMIGKTRQFRQLHVLSFWWIYLQSTGWGDKALSRKLVRIKSRETTVTLLLGMSAKKTWKCGNFEKTGVGVYPNPTSFVIWPSDIWHAKFILRC